MSWWKQRSQLHSGDSHSEDVTPGGIVYRSQSPPRKSRGKKAAADDYPNYAADTNRDGGYNGGGYGGGYSNGNGGGSAPYGNGNRGVTLYGGGGYNNPPSGNVSDDGYNGPPTSWTSQDPAGRTPMYISTREVHVYGAPQNFDDDQRRRGGGGGGGGGGFFGPAFHAVGHFVDRRFGLDDRN